MIDNLIVGLSFYLFGLAGLDWFNLHNFGIEALWALITALLIATLYEKGKNK